MAVVEFHGFKDNRNRFIVKELAIVTEGYCCQLMFKSPYPKHKLNSKMIGTANWLERFCHKISWSTGGVTFSKRIIIDLLKPFRTVYTKGLEKKKFLESFHSNVREIDFEPIEVDNTHCILRQHQDNTHCALRSAVYYHAGLIKLTDSFGKSSFECWQSTSKDGCVGYDF